MPSDEIPVSNLPLTKLVRKADLQSRDLRWELVEHYARLMEDRVEFPPLEVFKINGEYLLVDGWHRRAAAERINTVMVRCRVHEGTYRDALVFSCRSNSSHGLQRSRREINRAIDIALGDPTLAALSNRDLARFCGISESDMEEYRPRESPVDKAPSVQQTLAPEVKQPPQPAPVISEDEKKAGPCPGPREEYMLYHSQTGRILWRRKPERTKPRTVTRAVDCPICGKNIKIDIVRSPQDKIDVKIDPMKQRRESYR